jgi:hypothetical protein
VDFYGTAAQVIPVLLLALTWETDYLRRLRDEDRKDYLVFKKPVVRWWGLFMIVTALVGEGAMVLVLADVVEAGDIPKGLGLLGMASLVGSMAVRLSSDLWKATKPPKADPGTGAV